MIHLKQTHMPVTLNGLNSQKASQCMLMDSFENGFRGKGGMGEGGGGLWGLSGLPASW